MKCTDCDPLIDEVTRLTKQVAELTESADKVEAMEEMLGSLIQHVVENNLMTPEELLERGILIRPKGDSEELHTMLNKMREVLGPTPDCDCDACKASRENTVKH